MSHVAQIAKQLHEATRGKPGQGSVVERIKRMQLADAKYSQSTRMQVAKMLADPNFDAPDATRDAFSDEFSRDDPDFDKEKFHRDSGGKPGQQKQEKHGGRNRKYDHLKSLEDMAKWAKYAPGIADDVDRLDAIQQHVEELKELIQ